MANLPSAYTYQLKAGLGKRGRHPERSSSTKGGAPLLSALDLLVHPTPTCPLCTPAGTKNLLCMCNCLLTARKQVADHAHAVKTLCQPWAKGTQNGRRAVHPFCVMQWVHTVPHPRPGCWMNRSPYCLQEKREAPCELQAQLS